MSTAISTPTPTPPTPKRKHRVFPWFFLAVQIIFLLWVILGGVNAQHTTCPDGLSPEDCANAKGAGTTIGLALIFTFWAVTDFIIALSYAVYRLTTRKGS